MFVLMIIISMHIRNLFKFFCFKEIDTYPSEMWIPIYFYNNNLIFFLEYLGILIQENTTFKVSQ